MIQILSKQDIKQAELEAYSMGESSNSLINKAAISISNYLSIKFSQTLHNNVVILAGLGNNGNDGILTGCYLASNNYNVKMFRFGNGKKNELPNFVKHELTKRLKQDNIEYYEIFNLSEINLKLTQILANANIIIDSILGIGLNRQLSEEFSNLCNLVNNNKSNKNTIISIDVPTGVNADTGEVYQNDYLLHNKLAIKADLLLTLNYPKKGLFKLPAFEYFENIVVLNTGVVSRQVSNQFLLQKKDFNKVLPERANSSYKGSFGKLLIIGSSKEYPGAAFLAAKSAYRSGVGLVSIATTNSAISLYGSYLPEAIYCPLNEQPNGMISSNKENYKTLEIELAKYNTVLIGCGMGKSKETMKILEFILECHNKYELKFNLIIDADAINNLAELIKRSKVNLNNIILTPHLGELANLAQLNASNITLNERSEISELIIEKITNCNITNPNNTIVAKGPYTVIKDTSEIEYISPFATSLLSTAGSGDVLAGLIASLSAQGLNAINSSILGVYLHGLSALLQKKEYGNVGLLASDIADNIPFAIKKIREIV